MNPKSKLFSQIKEYWSNHRWLIVAAIGFGSAVVEYYEIIMDHAGPLDIEHIIEITLHGILLPAVLILLQRNETRKNKAVNTLTLVETFSYQLNKARDWEELLEVIVQFPRAMLPLTGISLWMHTPDSHTLDLELDRVFDGTEKSAGLPISIETEQLKCLHPTTNKVLGIKTCNCSLMSRGAMHDHLPAGVRYCLPLPNANLSYGLLHLYIPTPHVVTKEQRSLLNSVVPQIVMAMNKILFLRKTILQDEELQTERRRLANDLHDTLGQDLSYLRTKTDELIRNYPFQKIPLSAQDLQQMSMVVEEASQTVRSMLMATRSTVKNTLDARLLAYAKAIEERANFKVSLSADGAARELTSQMQFQIFLVFREILANIEKHANAQNVKIAVSWLKDELVLVISDDGHGFQTNSIDTNEHFGLSIIKTRIQEMNGDVAVTSIPGKGTEVSIRLPIISR